MSLPSSRTYAGWLAVARIATGLIWLIHALPKFLTPDRFLPPDGFIVSYLQQGAAKSVGPYHDFIVSTVLPNVGLFAELTRFGELCVGIALLFGLLTRLGGLVGFLLPLNYLAGRGALMTFGGWGSTDACLAILSAISLVLPTGRVFGIDALLARKPPAPPRVKAEFVPEPPLEGPTASP